MKLLRRWYHHMRYFSGEAWESCRDSLGVNLLALGTLVAALFLAGLALLAITNVDGRVQELRKDMRAMVYLAASPDEAERQALAAELSAIEGVDRVEFVSKEDALVRYREWANEMAGLAGELDSNPLPASFEVYLSETRAAATADRLVSSFAARPVVEEVRFDRAWIDRVDSILHVARAGGIALAVIVAVAIVFVMASALRLAVHSRREEVDIMLLVGATPRFIRGPFLVTGVMQGVLAALIALVLVEGVRRFALSWAGPESASVLGFVAEAPLPLLIATGLAGGGLVVSLAASYFAVRQSV